jgi:hypothetical protein
MTASVPLGGEPPNRSDQPQVAHRVRQLRLPLRLEVGRVRADRVRGVVVQPTPRPAPMEFGIAFIDKW